MIILVNHPCANRVPFRRFGSRVQFDAGFPDVCLDAVQQCCLLFPGLLESPGFIHGCSLFQRVLQASIVQNAANLFRLVLAHASSSGSRATSSCNQLPRLSGKDWERVSTAACNWILDEIEELPKVEVCPPGFIGRCPFR